MAYRRFNGKANEDFHVQRVAHRDCQSPSSSTAPNRFLIPSAASIFMDRDRQNRTQLN
uniref:Uncharacterized protein n=1 Tax=Rhizophora mucronata TaxID=61149 RepID=A0A2P2P3T7_RHIMU